MDGQWARAERFRAWARGFRGLLLVAFCLASCAVAGDGSTRRALHRQRRRDRLQELLALERHRVRQWRAWRIPAPPVAPPSLAA